MTSTELANEIARVMWNHWKLYKHGWDEPGEAPSDGASMIDAYVEILEAQETSSGIEALKGVPTDE